MHSHTPRLTTERFSAWPLMQVFDVMYASCFLWLPAQVINEPTDRSAEYVQRLFVREAHVSMIAIRPQRD